MDVGTSRGDKPMTGFGQSSFTVSKDFSGSLRSSFWAIFAFICDFMGLNWIRSGYEDAVWMSALLLITLLLVTSYIPAERSHKCLPKSSEFSDSSSTYTHNTKGPQDFN
jgi:hypothetical protein